MADPPLMAMAMAMARGKRRGPVADPVLYQTDLVLSTYYTYVVFLYWCAVPLTLTGHGSPISLGFGAAVGSFPALGIPEGCAGCVAFVLCTDQRARAEWDGAGRIRPERC